MVAGIDSTGKKLIIEWSPELRAAVDEVLGLRRKIVSMWLFHTNRGQPYIKADGTANGFDSIWQRFIHRVLIKTAVIERFTEHDLRAKVASDTTLDEASKLLGHSSTEITRRVYMRKTERVSPAKMSKINS